MKPVTDLLLLEVLLGQVLEITDAHNCRGAHAADATYRVSDNGLVE